MAELVFFQQQQRPAAEEVKGGKQETSASFTGSQPPVKPKKISAVPSNTATIPLPVITPR